MVFYHSSFRGFSVILFHGLKFVLLCLYVCIVCLVAIFLEYVGTGFGTLICGWNLPSAWLFWKVGFEVWCWLCCISLSVSAFLPYEISSNGKKVHGGLWFVSFIFLFLCHISMFYFFFCYLGSMCFWEFGLGLWFVVQIWLSRALYLKHGKCKCDLSSTKWHYCGILFNIGCKRAKLCKAWVRLV